MADFVAGKISYLGIADTIEKMMDEHEVIEEPTLEEIIEIGERIIGKN